MSKHDVSGGWVVLRDPKQVPERLRRPLLAMTARAIHEVEDANPDNISAESIQFYSEFNDALAMALVESWSFGSDVTIDALLDLPASTYDAIRELVAPLVADLMPNFEASPDPKATTDS